MISKYFSLIWAAVGPAVANHLWQSTLFAIVAALLTLTLRKNQARARYWLWLAASVKFFIPFSLLVIIGGQLARPSGELRSAPAGGFYSAVEEVVTVSDFLTVGLSRGQKPTANPQAPDRGYPLIHLLPVGLVGVWLCGFAVVLFVWCVRWRRMSRACQAAVPLREGRELEALRRLERLAGIRKSIEMLLSRSSLEPGIFGIIRPILVWPEGISKHLEDVQLEAILAHEVWHVRRRDNLAAAIHMAVEAIFWFHPLVWWLGGRLVEERERACDEEVLQLGNPPRVYAESILKTCEFCVGSPLACVSGVTGSDLKKRIVRIMTGGVARKLDVRKKLLLAAAGFLAIALPVGFGLANGQAGQANTPQSQASSQAGDTAASAPKFEIASIKPNKSGGRRMFFRIVDPPNDGRFYATGPTLRMLVRLAYDVQDSQIVGGPSWINRDRLDIQAKADSSVDAELRKLPPDQAKLVKEYMLQSLLADRFKLTLHRETRTMPIYALVVAKNGPKLQESKVSSAVPHSGGGPGGLVRMRFGGAQQEITSQGTSLPFLAQLLSQQLGRTVVDKTGLNGRYDFTLKWTPDIRHGQMVGGTGPGGPGPGGGAGGQSMAGMPPQPGSSDSSDSSGPSIFTAIQEQLGLRLKPEKGPVEVLVIDHIEQPTPN